LERDSSITTFGESHGKAIGCIIDGVPAGLKVDLEYIQSELDRRRPGKSKLETARREPDRVEILSGTFDGVSTGTPISIDYIYNSRTQEERPGRFTDQWLKRIILLGPIQHWQDFYH